LTKNPLNRLKISKTEHQNLIKSLSIITHSKSNTNPSKISTINQIEITRNHQEFLFKAIEIHRKTSLGFTGKSPLEVAGFQLEPPKITTESVAGDDPWRIGSGFP
jgi:hypothetical protein